MSQVKTWTREIQAQGELIARFKQAGLIWEGENERKYGITEERIGQCRACLSAVILRSLFVLSPGPILPGIPEMWEAKACLCSGCGILYSESHPRFQENILKFREEK